MTITAEWFLDAAGWLPAAARIDSPNRDRRLPGASVRLVVIHAISLPPGEFGGNAVTELFTNRLDPAGHPYYASLAGWRLSTHFFIRRSGVLLQFVSCLERAWHAGVSCWRGEQRCNDYSLGIELEGDDYSDYAVAQYVTLQRLLAALRLRYPLEAIVGHADIAPGRKTDPGPHFDWTAIAVRA